MSQTDVTKLVEDLRNALARERGGGTPLSREDYLSLDKRASDFIAMKKRQAAALDKLTKLSQETEGGYT